MTRLLLRRPCGAVIHPRCAPIATAKARVVGPRVPLLGSVSVVPGNSRPLKILSKRSVSAIAAQQSDSDDTHLISLEEQSDGTIVFSFGTSEEAQAMAKVASPPESAQDANPENEGALDPTPVGQQTDERGDHQGKSKSKGKSSRRTKYSRRRAAPKAQDQRPSPQTSKEKEAVKEQVPQAKGQRPAAVSLNETGQRKGKATDTVKQHSGPSAGTQQDAPRTKGRERGAKTPPAVSPESETIELHALKVPELRALAKERNLSGYSKLRKADLIELLSGGPQQ